MNFRCSCCKQRVTKDERKEKPVGRVDSRFLKFSIRVWAQNEIKARPYNRREQRRNSDNSDMLRETQP